MIERQIKMLDQFAGIALRSLMTTPRFDLCNIGSEDLATYLAKKSYKIALAMVKEGARIKNEPTVKDV